MKSSSEIIEQRLAAVASARESWREGPWTTEPDRELWVDETTGLRCLVQRYEHGALCGYVGLPTNHPWYENHDALHSVQVHGGLTYAEDPKGVVCDPSNETEELWWIGFDCAHSPDLCPGRISPDAITKLYGRLLTFDAGSNSDKTYRTFQQVKKWTTALAQQAGAVMP